MSSVLSLNSMSGVVGRRKSKALGRGPGSGKGKTSGRGGKGQTARSGVSLNGFEGGQMPIYRRLPKRGFHNFNRVEYQVLSLSDVCDLVKSGKLQGGSTISIDALCAAIPSLGKKVRKGIPIKLLSDVESIEDVKFSIQVHSASKKAIEIVSASGGEVVVL